MQRLDEARKTDPQADLFQEARLNRLGYRVLRSGSAANSIPIFRRIVELFPASSNAYDSLAEALEAAGERREAVAVTERAPRSAGEAGADSRAAARHGGITRGEVEAAEVRLLVLSLSPRPRGVLPCLDGCEAADDLLVQDAHVVARLFVAGANLYANG